MIAWRWFVPGGGTWATDLRGLKIDIVPARLLRSPRSDSCRQPCHFALNLRRAIEIVQLERILLQVIEQALPGGTAGDEFRRPCAGHHLALSRFAEDHFPLRTIRPRSSPRISAKGCRPAARHKVGRQIDVAHQAIGDRGRTTAARPFDHQRHLRQGIVHVIALQQHVVIAQVFTVIGSEDDERVVVKMFLLKQGNQPAHLMVDLRDRGIVIGHCAAQVRLGQPIVRKVPAVELQSCSNVVGVQPGKMLSVWGSYIFCHGAGGSKG